MQLGKVMQYIRQLSTYVLAIVIGVFLSGCLWVLPSQADPVPQATISQAATPAAPTQKAAIQPNSFVTAAVNRVGQAVVRIDTERTITRRLPDPFSDDPFFRRFFGENFPQQLPPERLQGLGSGFIVDSSGEILTNAHVVAQADKVTVTLKDGRVLEGQVQGVDEVTDLAAIKVNGKNLPVAPLGDSSSVQVGDWAIAVGNPLGLDNTVTLGIVSTLKRSSAQVGIPDKRLDFIQTDAAINPGNSGGPLLNDRGEVIGINTAIRADGMGIGFAIPIDKAKAIKDRLIRGEQVAHPYIGVQMETLTPSLARQNNSDPNSAIQIPEVNGVLVVRVLPNSPAAAAGLRRGDVIVQVDGQTITKAEQLQSLVEDTQVGQAIQVKVRRGDRTQQLSVRTGELQSASLK
ncbi:MULTISPECIES: HhoA/HhoB/HtrA family serine endopeptidase [Chroococcidiopsis]|uniref:HtrA2 peptidase n=1 Tax=Chroococcidiopsis thermalis (strain PCC 7203) TaxID=251229 RepID=K9TTV7_CHRTP|nr:MULTISPECIES: HhoA/HhoB/HtrA family serine endopeptidase [Chroococcidiopsis]AFY86000.1 HtrA2 peptidase [Chroococcidiopsis thermalis PCC 7203]MBE9019005.1 trypsin-like peptidase domain-containing protein [Chroococcidiopsidales cyanobacterium LEGE 13417]PSM51139.1 PDZ domain-containing protein [Chroococcidiopsis sp. CCALA 051]